MARTTDSALPLRRQLRKLKKLGLFRGDTERPSKYARRRVRKFDDLLAGRSKVVTVKAKTVAGVHFTGRELAQRYKKDFPRVGNKVVVPAHKGEKFHINREGRISSTRIIGGRKIQRIVIPFKGAVPVAPKGHKYMYYIPFNRGRHGISRKGWTEIEDLNAWMSDPLYAGYKNYANYIEVEEVDEYGQAV